MQRVDFHNQRLHGIVTKPYGEDDEGQRIHHAVAVAQLIIDVLDETGDDDEQIPNAIVKARFEKTADLVKAILRQEVVCGDAGAAAAFAESGNLVEFARENAHRAGR